MRKIFLFLFIINVSFGLRAQSKIEGAYYLRGAMEVGSGFLLKPDSTFQFFFAYGALDREGSGKWTIKGKHVIFNTISRPQSDFTLINSSTVNNNFTTIKIVDSNKNLLRYVYAYLKFSDTTLEEKTNDEGELEIPRKGVENISLVFEFSPEKISNFKGGKDYNYYEFRMESTITEVFFENFQLQIGSDELKGKHPLLDEKEYVYEKEKN